MKRPVWTRGWWWLTWLPWRPSCERTGHHDFCIPVNPIGGDPMPGVQMYVCECSIARGYDVDQAEA